MFPELVVMTTFREGSQTDPVERVRTEVFLDTAKNCRELGLPLLAVYVDSSEQMLGRLRALGTVLIAQNTSGMGAIRRQAMQAASNRFPQAKYFAWIEPEKPEMPQICKRAVQRVNGNGTAACFFNRIAMNSYPREQAHYYQFARAVASSLIGFEFDYAFGPMVLNTKALQFFLEYRGEYGDLWDAILIPRIRVIRSGMPFKILSVPFHNDPRMTAIESGNPAMIQKRLKQFENVVSSFLSEWECGETKKMVVHTGV